MGRPTVVAVHITSAEAPYAYGLAGAVLITLSTLGLSIRSRRALRRRLSSLAVRLGHSNEDVSGLRLEAVVSRLELAAEQSRLDADDANQRAARLAGALDAMGTAVVVCDEAGEVDYGNPAAAALRHNREATLVQDAVSRLVAEVGSTGQPVERRLDLAGPPRRSYRLRADPIDDGRRGVGTVALAEEMTALERADHVRRDFIANAAHELHAPMGSIAVLAAMLLEETTVPVIRKLAIRLGEEAGRVARMIGDLLDLSRLEAELSPNRAAVDLASVVVEACYLLEPLADQRGVVLDAGAGGPGPTVIGDRHQLVAAVFNLVENAVKFSDRDQTVEVRAEASGAEASVLVRDQGIGIPADQRDRIFEHFYRVERGRSDDVGGSGLGLSIVRQVALVHGGSVDVESNEGAGSTFTLRLPLSPEPGSRPERPRGSAGAQGREMDATPFR